MSILSEYKVGDPIPVDNVFVIYGAPGSGKTTLASSFPATEEKPLLYIDILEGGGGVIDASVRPFIQRVPVTKFEDFDEILTDLVNGYTVDSKGTKIPLSYSTIVIDTVTQLEYILKEYLKKTSRKDTMNLQLWGQAKDSQDYIYNTLKLIQVKTGAAVVAIAQEKKLEDEENPRFNKVIPALMTSAAISLCARASYVWYCKVEQSSHIDPNTKSSVEKLHYTTYINTHPFLYTKSRTMKGFVVQQKAENLTYDAFKRHIIDRGV